MDRTISSEAVRPTMELCGPLRTSSSSLGWPAIQLHLRWMPDSQPDVAASSAREALPIHRVAKPRWLSARARRVSAFIGIRVGYLPAVLVDLSGPFLALVRGELPGSVLARRLCGSSVLGGESLWKPRSRLTHRLGPMGSSRGKRTEGAYTSRNRSPGRA